MKKRKLHKFKIPSDRHPLKKFHKNIRRERYVLSEKELEALHTPVGSFDQFYQKVGKKKYRAYWWSVNQVSFTKKRLEEIRTQEGGY